MKKPYKIEAREFGKGRPSVESFADLTAATQFIKDRWQGAEYVDGADQFHTDYCSYTLRGFVLADVGRFSFEGDDRVFTFNSAKPVCAPASRKCEDDSCDGAHCTKCGGHFADFYHGGPVCLACSVEDDDPPSPSDGFDPRAPFPHPSDPHWSSPDADFARW